MKGILIVPIRSSLDGQLLFHTSKIRYLDLLGTPVPNFKALFHYGFRLFTVLVLTLQPENLATTYASTDLENRSRGTKLYAR